MAVQLPVLSPPFTVLSFADPVDTDMVISYGPGHHFTISTDDNDIQDVLTAFTTLAEAAMSSRESLRMIDDVVGEFR